MVLTRVLIEESRVDDLDSMRGDQQLSCKAVWNSTIYFLQRDNESDRSESADRENCMQLPKISLTCTQEGLVQARRHQFWIYLH
jgi:hypothetical protein